jgi:uncharacterized protein with NRDE domain
MCTLAIFFDVFDGYPLVVAANRDERYDRPATPPALISADPKIVAGKDLRAGGTWLGVSEHGLLVGLLNRRINRESSLHSQARSRGLLCLDLLRLQSAAEAGEFLSRHGETYNPFTVLYADAKTAGVAFNNENGIILRPLSSGLHVFSSAAEIDTTSGKADRAYKRFMGCATELSPETESAPWLAKFKTLLGDHNAVSEKEPRDAVCIHGPESGTVSSSVIYYSSIRRSFETYFCAGAPCQNSFGAPLALEVL